MPSRVLALVIAGVASLCWAGSGPRLGRTSCGRCVSVTWVTDGSAEGQQLRADAEARLHEELERRAVPTRPVSLKVALEVVPGGLRLRVVTLRERAVLGSVVVQARGGSRGALLRALIRRACDEALELDV